MATEQGPRQHEAHDYLNKHRILDLFNNLTAQLIYNRPEEPKKFIIATLEKLNKSRNTRFDYPCLFDDSNIQSVFGMLDPTGRGFISLQQYKEAFSTFGITEFEEEPAGTDIDRITYEVFLKELKKGLAQASATFST